MESPSHLRPSRHLVLASSSPARRTLLGKLGLPFDCAAPEIAETPFPGESPDALAARLSLEKAQAAATRYRKSLIIGSDQVGWLEGKQLSKPLTRTAAIEQLRTAAGKTTEFFTGICVLDAASGESKVEVDRYLVRFKTLAYEQIERYVDRDRPFGCAGSFKCEGLGIVLFEELNGSDPNALVGLPLIRLIRMLDHFGVPVL